MSMDQTLLAIRVGIAATYEQLTADFQAAFDSNCTAIRLDLDSRGGCIEPPPGLLEAIQAKIVRDQRRLRRRAWARRYVRVSRRPRNRR